MPSKKLKAPPKTVNGLMEIARRDVLWTNYLTSQALAKPSPFLAMFGLDSNPIRAVVDTIPKPPSWWQQPELFAMWKARYGHRI